MKITKLEIEIDANKLSVNLPEKTIAPRLEKVFRAIDCEFKADVISNSNEKKSKNIFPFYFCELDVLKDFDINKYSSDSKFFASNISEKGFLEKLQYLSNDCEIEQTYLPIIFFSYVDLFDEELIKNHRYAFFPRSLNFMDSSIWFYYIPYNRNKQHPNDQVLPLSKRLENGLKDIANHYLNNLYNSYICIENRDLNFRLFKNSYIEDVAESRMLNFDKNTSNYVGPQGHQKHVIPFIFHTRTDIIEKRKEIFFDSKTQKETLLGKYAQNLKWRMLLVDDYADKVLKNGASTIDPTKNGVGLNEFTKMKVIENVLGKHETSVTPRIFGNSETPTAEKEDIKRCSAFQKIWQRLSNAIFGQDKIHNKHEQIKEVKTKSNTYNGIITIESVNPENDKNSGDDIIWKALKKLSEETYDIILLDYLLGERPNNSEREYSHEFLKIIDGICNEESGYAEDNYSEIENYVPQTIVDINRDKSSDDNKINLIIRGIKFHKGPLGKFWILNISSFQTAFLDRLREQGLGFNSEHWYLSRGADPINTPELFKYELYSFLKLQSSQAIVTKDELIKFFIQNDLNSIKVNDGLDIRGWAKVIYGAFIYKFGKREIISKDNECQSVFAASVVIYINAQLESDKAVYYDHLRQLLFQLAYGTGYNVRQTIELFYIVKQEFKEAELKTTFEEIGNYLNKTSNNY